MDREKAIDGMDRKRIEVAAAIIHRDGLWFAAQRGYGGFEGKWEFPGGKLEPGETPGEALRREIREELAVEIIIERPLLTVEYDYPDFHLTMHCFLCALSAPGSEPTLVEAKSAKWLPASGLPALDWLPADREIVSAILRLSPAD